MTPTPPAPCALIAEDEPLLALSLQQALTAAWPQLQITTVVGDGLSATQEALRTRPDVLFLDIRMPGQSGLDAAADIADQWPQDAPFPAIVFVTAYDQYAVQAFEAQAMDYVLKPVQPERLARTVQRLRTWWEQRQRPTTLADHATAHTLKHALLQLQQLNQQLSASAPLALLQAGIGPSIHMVPVQEVIFMEAADKYVRVLTASHEYLLRTALKDLLPRLDAQQFWQIHRGTVVRAASIACVQRDESGRLWVHLHGRPDKLAVSRLYATRFKPM